MITLSSPPPVTRRPITADQWWISTAAALLCLLQVLTLGERNPLTRTLSSDEYTPWGWMFPASLVAFGAVPLRIRPEPGARYSAVKLRRTGFAAGSGTS